MKYIILSLSILFITLSCASKEERLQNSIQLVNQIKGISEFEVNNKLFYSNDDVRSSFTYYVKNDQIKIVNEEMFFNNNSNSNSVYYFNDERLIYLKRIEMKIEERDNQRIRKDIEIEIYFDKNYDALYSFKVENKQEAEISSNELKLIFSHGQKLFDLSNKNLDSFKR